MSEQQMIPQTQKPTRIGASLTQSIVRILAVLWRSIFWIWSIFILGIIIGVLGNAVFTLLTTGKIDFTGTFTVLTWLNTHLTLCIVILIPILVLTFCSFLAHRRQRRAAQEHQHLHEESLIVLAKGVQKALDERASKPTTPPFTPSSMEAIQQELAPAKAIWNVPYQRNPYFTGREHLLNQLRENLTTNTATALTQAQAINGLGGIGKTQTAVEYAYRYRAHYQTVLWVNAETEDLFRSDMVLLAQPTLLNLPQKDEKEQHIILDAVIEWLNTHTGWLLILDNVEHITSIFTLLFQRTPLALQHDHGHVLLTTRSQAVGPYINAIEIEIMDTNEGAHFLLQRAKKNPYTKEEYALAQTIVEAMNGLPLAIDQAGAYMEETHCSVSHYLHLYQDQKTRTALLQRRGMLASDHPASVAVTFTLSLQQVQQQSAVAADILRTCAFLSPEHIPEAIMIEGATELGPARHTRIHAQYALDKEFTILQAYSLIYRDAEQQTISLHRLVQAVTQESMNKDEQRLWVERIVQAINRTFPDSEYTNWASCQQYLAHVRVCQVFIHQWKIETPEAAHLLHQTANYLYDRAQYPEAEALYQQALAISKKTEGPDHPSTGSTLHELARLYQAQGRYPEAEPLYQQALAIYQKALGPDHPKTKIASKSYNQLKKKK